MENMQTLIQFIEKQMTLFNIENNKKNVKKIYKKCQRELEKLNFWEEAPKILIGKNRTKTFTLGQINILKHNTEDYFLKRSPYSKEEFDKIIKHNIENFEKEIGLLSENTEIIDEFDEFSNFTKPEISKSQIIELMITTLFTENYEINFKLWNDDLTYIHQTEYITSPVELHEFTCQTEFLIRNNRLKNPIAYVSKKKKTIN